MNSPLLEKISQPSDLKKLSSQQTVQLCAEIRDGGSAPGADHPHG